MNILKSEDNQNLSSWNEKKTIKQEQEVEVFPGVHLRSNNRVLLSYVGKLDLSKLLQANSKE